MRRHLVFSVACLAMLLYSISSSSVSVAFPVLLSDFDTSLVVTGWVLTAYQLVSVTVMPLAGKIGEVLGKRRAFILNVLVFTIGSMLCAVAPNIGWLIAFRVIQAIGGGGIMPNSVKIISDAFPEARQRYVGLISTVMPFGAVLGPNVGGWMVESFGWRSVFWFNVPLSIIVIVLSWLLLETGDRNPDISFDYRGAGLLFGSIVAFMFSLTEVGNSQTGLSGVSWWLVGLLFALSVALLIGFLRQEQRAREPVIELETLKGKPFMASNIYNFLYGCSVQGFNPLIPLYAVSIFGMSILGSGVVITPRSVGMMIASTITSFYLRRWGYRWPILLGTIATAGSLIILALEAQGTRLPGSDTGDILSLLLVLGLSGIGSGLAAPAANNASLELMPDKIATIAGLRGVFRQLGAAVSIAISTVVMHTIGDMHQAFYVVALALAALMILSIPSIFFLPGLSQVRASRGQLAKTVD